MQSTMSKRLASDIAAIMGKVVDGVVSGRSFEQEEPITTRIAQKLESDISGRSFQYGRGESYESAKVKIESVVIPSKGRGSLEKKLGADLLFGFEIIYRESTVKKALLVQAKKGRPRGKVSRQGTSDQLAKMYKVAPNGSSLMVYGRTGALCIEAGDFISQNGIFSAKNLYRRPADFFEDVLICKEGDRQLGAQMDMGDPKQMYGVLSKSEFAQEKNLSVILAEIQLEREGT